jgi:hypothetical protein
VELEVRMLRRGETARPVCATACILLVLLLLYHSSGAVAMLGRIKEVGNVSNSLEIDELAKFAVDEHNGREVCCSFFFILCSLMAIGDVFYRGQD